MGEVSRLLRWLTFGFGGRVSRDQAAELARLECLRRDLPWIGPIKVYAHYGDWSVWTFAGHRGGNIRVIIDRRSGSVIRVQGPTPR